MFESPCTDTEVLVPQLAFDQSIKMPAPNGCALGGTHRVARIGQRENHIEGAGVGGGEKKGAH